MIGTTTRNPFTAIVSGAFCLLAWVCVCACGNMDGPEFWSCCRYSMRSCFDPITTHSSKDTHIYTHMRPASFLLVTCRYINPHPGSSTVLCFPIINHTDTHTHLVVCSMHHLIIKSFINPFASHLHIYTATTQDVFEFLSLATTHH